MRLLAETFPEFVELLEKIALKLHDNVIKNLKFMLALYAFTVDQPKVFCRHTWEKILSAPQKPL